MYEMGEYKEAIQHCQCIPIDFRLAKYWKLGGKFGSELINPKVNHVYIETILTLGFVRILE